MLDSYSNQGIIANQIPMDESNNLTIKYEGLLFRSGADTVFAHCGYGTKWTTSKTIKMINTDDGFRVNIPVTRSGTINVAFKDSASNWDNNNGSNYSFSVKSKQ